ncbi:type VI secretion system baseplate subunit TssK [Erwinia sp.]|uniref:type VI secretion system baseplate subunit TssK n=1 Tax=Erwinia citreus TaxID=558 RepID=UPI003C71F57D
MKIYRPLWNEGALLSPQQFQQQSAWESFTNAGIAALTSPSPWGVEQLELDELQLASGRVLVQKLRVWFPGGTLVDTQHCDLVPTPRDVSSDVASGMDSVTLLLALPLMQPGGGNANVDGIVAERPQRFREEWVNVQDVFGPEHESMAVARFNLAIRFQHESNDAWESCPLCRLIRNGQGGWQIDPEFIPPLVLFSSCQALHERLVLLNRQLRSRRQRLMLMRRESNERLADFAVADVSLFWLLNALNSHASVLSEFERVPDRHPEQVWAELARLAGSIMTFSLEHDIETIPAYHHDSPARTFPPLFDLIATLLESSLPSRVIALEMSRPDTQTWRASLHDLRLREDADFYLSVRSDMPAWRVTEGFPELCKAGAPDDVNAISSSALNGIPLMTVSRVPAALPVRLENQYFALDMESPAAAAMLDQGVCLFYVPQLLGNIELELFAVLRS